MSESSTLLNESRTAAPSTTALKLSILSKHESGLVVSPDVAIASQEADWRRWIVLLNFLCFASSNAIQWIVLAPVVKQSREYFGMTSFQVDMMSLSYLITFPLISPFSATLFDKFGYKPTIIMGNFINLLSAIGRLAAVYWSPNFTMLIIAQFCGAMAQCAVVATPPVIADLWFPARQRTLANLISANSLNVGIALGLLVPPLIVDEQHKDTEAFAILCGGFVLTHAVISFLFSCVIPAESRIPMSPKAKKKAAAIGNPLEAEELAAPGLAETLSKTREALRIPAFRFLTVAVGVGVGSVWAFSTVYTQIFSPFGITEQQAGLMGAVNITAGVVFAVSTSSLFDRYKLYKGPLLVCMAIVVVADGLMLLVFETIGKNQSDSHTTFILTFALYTTVGLAQALVGGIGMELAAEVTFPVSPAVTGAFLMSSASLFALGMTVGTAALLGDHPTQSEAVYAMLIFIGTGAVAAASMVPIKAELRRLQHEGFDTIATP